MGRRAGGAGDDGGASVVREVPDPLDGAGDLGINGLGALFDGPQRLANALGDWLDADDLPAAPDSAESAYYTTLTPSYRAANRLLDDVDDLLRVRECLADRAFHALHFGMLEDVCEALVAAVYLDAGFAAAQAVIEQALGPRVHRPRRPLRDAKQLLQEWAQGRGKPPPAYRVVARSGPDHAPNFVVEASLEGAAPAHGEGSTKREAEQAAARAMMDRDGIGRSAGDG